MTSCTVVKNDRMNSGRWFPMLCRMPSETATFERLSSIVPKAMPLTYSTMSGRLVCRPRTVTSSARAKWLASGRAQSTSHTVSVCSPAPGLTFTPYRSRP